MQKRIIANFLYFFFLCFGKFIIRVDIDPSKAKLLHVSHLLLLTEAVFPAKQSNILEIKKSTK